jgi:prepilin-type processing-associated H-X9-DG protein
MRRPRLILSVVAALSVVTAFAVTRTGHAAQGQAPGDTQCLSNTKQIAIGLLMYIQDYDDTLPPMKSTASVQTAIFPYIKNKAVFTCPVTKKGYVYSAALGKKKMAQIKAPASTVMLKDAVPHPDGMTTVAYLDGHCKRIKLAAPKK